ncbi:LuxR C-terminal-related transcriptional regulator [Marinifilum sp.]|uniref:LuxR C-terminal-related transcriptional regulator n=1 Tax=Marinifilum sp. TaxID=2033137 RepID=UPI003BAA220E
MPRTTILIAENTCLIRKGLRAILHNLGNAEILHSVTNKNELYELVNRLKPGILIVNPNMLNFEDEDAKRTFVSAEDMSLVLISGDDSIRRKYKADAFIHYQDNQKDILKLLEEIIEQKSGKDRNTKSNETLSAREQNILKHIALGFTNKEIADQLFISIHTVVTHRKNITHKLGIKSVSGLTVYAILNNLISMDEVK